MKKVKAKQQWLVVTIVSCLIAMVWNSTAHALGMGVATTESYIGQRLSVYIPLFNVNSPKNLSVILQRSQNDGLSDNTISAEVERINSQLGIRVSSQRVTTEPFVSFIIEVLDNGSVTSKEFTVLLDLPINQITNDSSPFIQESVFVDGDLKSGAVGQIDNNLDVMGPYDWAVAGQVAQTFGPVLDGQSLWRVARRINKALDVSIDQMMWSLYQNNRDQFANDSITSLNAGAFLKIPSAQQASQISELAAKRNIEQLSGSGRVSSSLSGNEAKQPVKKVVSQTGQTSNHNDDSSAGGSFELTGLDLASSGAKSLGDISQKSQQIISSLAESVGNLTQELIKKDQKISFLEEKIAALEKYAQVSASELTSETVVEPNNVDIEKIVNDVIEPDVEVAELKSTIKVVELDSSDNIKVVSNDVGVIEDSVKPSLKVNKPSVALNDSAYKYEWWHGLLLSLILLGLLLILCRKWLVNLVKSLHFKDDNEIEFDPSEYQQEDKEVKKVVVEQIDPDLTVENKPKLNGLSQKSILDSMKSKVEVDDALSPQTLIDLDGDFSYSEMYSDDVFAEDNDEVGLSFFERYNKALVNQDFGFALQLLNMAKGNEVDEAVYHYQRLRMYESMHDENAFYDYFCEIEDQIPSFDKDTQKQISQLVLEMAEQ